MRIKQLLTMAIFLGAIGLAAFVIIDNQLENNAIDENEQALLDYVSSGGNERSESSFNDEFSEYEEQEEVGLELGMKAKDFTLPLLSNDDDLTLSELQGNYVVVNMWATWCPPCRDEMPDFIEFYEEYKDEDVEIVGVNMTKTERNLDVVDQFVEDFEITFPTVVDQDGIMEEMYEVYVMPTTYLIDPDGRVAMRRQGFINYDMLESYYIEVRERFEKEQ